MSWLTAGAAIVLLALAAMFWIERHRERAQNREFRQYVRRVFPD